MSKNIIQPMTVEELRTELYESYRDKYYRLWMSRYSIEGEGVSDEAQHWLWKQFWLSGNCAAGKIKNLDEIFFARWTAQEFGLYYEPKVVRFELSNRNVPYIPTGPQQIDKDVVIGYATDNRNVGIYDLIDVYLKKMVEIDLITRTNLLQQQMPFLLTIDTVGNKGNTSVEKAKNIINQILSFKEAIITDVNVNEISSLVTNVPWLVPELIKVRYDVESQLKTILGIDCTAADMGSQQIVLTEQLDANMAELALSKLSIDKNIKLFIKKINETFGMNLKLIDNLQAPTSAYQKDMQPERNDNEVNEEVTNDEA